MFVEDFAKSCIFAKRKYGYETKDICGEQLAQRVLP
jgi:hypothetical protein